MMHRNNNINDLDNEIWKPAVGLEQICHISNLGRVKRLNGHSVSNRISKKTGEPYKQTLIPIQEKILLGTINKKGYVNIKLSFNIDNAPNSKRTSLSKIVHRMVAEAFIPNPNNYPQVNHINGISTDNNVDNLEWCTNEYNQMHRYEILGRNKDIIDTNKNRVIKVHKLDHYGNVLKTYDSITEAATLNKTFTTNICKVSEGKRKTAAGYGWRIDEESRYNRYRHDGEIRD